MSSGIKPIETLYAGHRFRSRLEARWAVFFDTLGIRWQYESEGYETPDGRYLPDFLLTLPHRQVFLEVKPESELSTPNDPRWKHTATLLGGLYVTYGLMDSRVRFGIDGFPLSTDFGFSQPVTRIWPNDEREWFLFFCACPHCQQVDIKPCGNLLETIPSTEWIKDEQGWRQKEDDESENYYTLTSCDYRFSCCHKEFNACQDDFGLPMYHGGVPRIINAYDVARSARFEYGENG